MSDSKDEELTPVGKASTLPRQVWILVLILAALVISFVMPWGEVAKKAKQSLPIWMISDEESPRIYIDLTVSAREPIKEIMVPLSVDDPTKWIRIVGSTREIVEVNPPMGFIIIPERGDVIRINASSSLNQIELGRVYKRPFRLLALEAGQVATVTGLQ